MSARLALACLAALCLAACPAAESPDPPACAAFPQAFVTVYGETVDGVAVEPQDLSVSIDGGAFESVPCDPGQCQGKQIMDAEGQVVVRGGWQGESAEVTISNVRSDDGCSIPNPTATLVFDIPDDGCRGNASDDDDEAGDDDDDDDPCG